MKKRILGFALLIGMVIIAASFTYNEKNQKGPMEIAYPEGYRNWTHIKTYVVGPKSPAFPFIGGFNHVYANEKALKGYQTSHFPEGSIIVSDVIAAQYDSMNIREGRRHHLDVMVKDSLNYSETGGWGFEQFSEDSKTSRLLTVEKIATCANCHKKEKDMIFSVNRN